jgi:hypothetical protein
MKLFSSTIFTCGPFAESAEMVEEFGSKMYFSYLFSDSIKKHEEIQKKYEEALLLEDEELANIHLAELKMMEGVYKVSFSMFSTDEMVPS